MEAMIDNNVVSCASGDITPGAISVAAPINIVATEVAAPKPYNLRNLSAEDVFIMSTILKNIGFKEFKGCLQSAEMATLIGMFKDNEESTEKPSIESIGLSLMMDVAGVIISNMENAKDSIYKLLSNLSGMTIDEISKLDMEIFFEMIIDVFRQKGFSNFIKVASKFLR